MLSEKMLKYLPKSTVFMNNLGSYNFVVKQDYKAARKVLLRNLTGSSAFRHGKPEGGVDDAVSE